MPVLVLSWRGTELVLITYSFMLEAAWYKGLRSMKPFSSTHLPSPIRFFYYFYYDVEHYRCRQVQCLPEG